MSYIIAYPHPAIRPTERIKRLELELETTGKTLIGLFQDLYPGHAGDLVDATLRKATGLSYSVVIEDSLEKVYDWIRKDSPGTVMWRFQIMGESFPEGAHDESAREVDIVAVTPEIIEAMDPHEDVDNDSMHTRVRTALCELMKMASSPSESIASFASIRDAVESPSGPRFGRPSDRFGPPTVLFSRELALLKHDLDNLNGLTPDSVGATLAFNLIENATSYSDNEGEREVALRPILRELLAGYNQLQMLTADRQDGAWLEEPSAYPIVEIKDELGFGGDPLLQGLIVYSKALTHKKCRPFLDRSNLPVVLLTIAGNRLVVAAAIFTDSIYADELLSLTLRFGPHAPDNVLRVARVFMAINRCMERLRTLYRNVGTSTPSAPPAKFMWPNPTPDPPLSVEWIGELEFFSKVDRFLGTPINQTVVGEDNKQHAIYLARMRTGDGTSTTVFVKFSVKYNPDAHKILAGHNPPLAPALHYCAPVIGDMYMVVMEYVSKALKLLHDRELVFGDLREQNVLYLPEGGGRAMLVDFDNVGRDGKDRYSACLNPDAGLGVGRLQIMEKSHDAKNMERLLERLSVL